MALVGVRLLTPGTSYSSPADITELDVTPLDAGDPSTPGTFAVESLTYGSGEPFQVPE